VEQNDVESDELPTCWVWSVASGWGDTQGGFGTISCCRFVRTNSRLRSCSRVWRCHLGPFTWFLPARLGAYARRHIPRLLRL